jgi:hypothetical protein
MSAELNTYRLLKGVLDPSDIDFLRQSSASHLVAQDMPCYVLLDRLKSPVVEKITELVSEALGGVPHYLNDFYFYSDSAFGAQWHVDTELFTFDDCVNAWILLSPDRVTGPLAFIGDLNGPAEPYFHNVKPSGDDYVFTNYRTGAKETRPAAAVEAARIDTPPVALGDVLLINPRRFHKTNTTAPKHAMVIKFVIEGAQGLLSKTQVPAMFWPEVGMFNAMLKGAENWDGFLAALRDKLGTEEGRKALSAGFFPEKIDLYKRMARTLVPAP